MALKGLKVIELAGLAPVPFAGMVLADFGASVVRIDRPDHPSFDTLGRGKRSIAVNLRHSLGKEVALEACRHADVVLEPFRPGVMERLGLGPDVLMRNNPRLVYARLTGFGQHGCLSHRAGHDINYVAISGILSLLGRKDENPNPPVNLLGDFAGGGLMCVVGILMALLERTRSSRGQVIDAAMVDGCSYLASFLLSPMTQGLATGRRGTNLLDGGAPFYDVFKTSDGKYMSVGALEPQFYQALLEGLGLSGTNLPAQMDQEHWPQMKEKFAAVFLTKTRDEWTKIFSKLDACVEPVLEVDEAVCHPHNKERQVFSSKTEANPAPKLQRTPAMPATSHLPEIGEHTVEILKELNYTQERIKELLKTGTVVQHKFDSKL